MAIFDHITTNPNTKAIRGGYKDFLWFCPLADFATIATPLAVPLALGDEVEINGDHTFAGTNGFFKWELKQKSPTIKGTSVGDPGAKLIEYTGEVTILGDEATTQAQLERLLNSKGICLLKDANCTSDDVYAQLGDECDTPEFTVEFDGKTTAEGLKEYKVSIKVVAAKYVYSGAVTESTA
jgi:hypothetical protein